jgi:hypothetical protein
VTAGGGDELPFQSLDVFGGNLEVVTRFGDVVLGLGLERLSLFHRENARHLVDPGLP